MNWTAAWVMVLLFSTSEAAMAASIGPARSHPRTAVVGTTLSAEARTAVARVRLVNDVDGNTYVGSEVCMTCHSDMQIGRGSQHASAYIQPMAKWTLVPGKGVLANSLGRATDDFLQGLDFNTISSPFDPYKPNAPKLSVKNGVYTITIGVLDLPVIFTLQWRFDTGDWEQLYAVRVPVADSPKGRTDAVYSSPLFYTTDGGWEAYAPEAWWDAINQPRYGVGAMTATVVANAESHDQNCVGCHATGTRSISQNERGEWVFRGFLPAMYSPDDPGIFDYDGDGFVETMNIGCESCHGPGGDHVIGNHNRSTIVNPGRLDPKSANDVCGQCHSVIASAPQGLIGWPYDEVAHKAWIPGSGPLDPYITDAEVYWPDGKTGMDTSQYPEFLKSAKPGFAPHPVLCFDCHDPHGPTRNPAQIAELRYADGVKIATKVEDDTLCLSCHAGFGKLTSADFSSLTAEQVAAYNENHDVIGHAVSAHSHHPYGPERTMGLSRCTGCHMARTQGPDSAQVLHGHTFEALSPQKTLKYQADGGMPNSCALSCHGSLANVFGLGLDPTANQWNEPFDVSLATGLLKYFGPDGLWWRVNVDAVTARSPQATVRTVRMPQRRSTSAGTGHRTRRSGSVSRSRYSITR